MNNEFQELTTQKDERFSEEKKRFNYIKENQLVLKRL